MMFLFLDVFFLWGRCHKASIQLFKKLPLLILNHKIFSRIFCCLLESTMPPFAESGLVRLRISMSDINSSNDS